MTFTSATDTEQFVSKLYVLLHSGDASTALHMLWSPEITSRLATDPCLYLAHARLSAEFGHYSEALRSVEEMHHSPSLSKLWRARARTWAAVYWTRLQEYDRAWHLLDSAFPDTSEYTVLKAGHSLTIAAETNDRDRFTAVLQRIEEQPLSRGSAAAAELDIWRSLIGATFATPRDDEIAHLSQNALAYASDVKPIIKPYILIWLARLYRALGDVSTARQHYSAARTTALSSSHGYSFLRATTELLELLLSESGSSMRESKENIRNMMTECFIMLGETGIAWLPCALARRIRTLLTRIPLTNSFLQNGWLSLDRRVPVFNAMVGKQFEEWCALLLNRHSDRLFGIQPSHAEVEQTVDANPVVDIWVSSKLSRIAVQCKGGSRRLRTDSLSSRDKGFRELLELTRTQHNCTHYVLMATTKLGNEPAAYLRSTVREVLGNEPFILDRPKLVEFWQSDVELRLRLTQAVLGGT